MAPHRVQPEDTGLRGQEVQHGREVRVGMCVDDQLGNARDGGTRRCIASEDMLASGAGLTSPGDLVLHHRKGESAFFLIVV